MPKKRSDIIATLSLQEKSPELAVILADDLKAMQAALRGVFPRAQPRARKMLASYLNLISRGYYHNEAEARSKARWAQIRAYIACSPDFKAIYMACKEAGEELRQQIREHALDQRAVKGWLEPVFYKGAIVGHVRKFSDKCLEMAVKGGDKTGKYADHQKVEHTGAVIQYNITGVPPRGSTPGPVPAKSIDAEVTVIPLGNATKSQPKPQKPHNPEEKPS